MKRTTALLTALVLCACPAVSAGMTAHAAAQEDDIVILYTNDVHCGITDHIGYDGLALYQKEMESAHAHVLLADTGDAIQGGTIGTMTNGAALVELMDAVGYDVCVPGNHEFDYSIPELLARADELDCGYTCCNLYDVIQTNVDAVREQGADTVILLGHLDEHDVTDAWSAPTIAANTTGIDAVIDGHSHEVTPSMVVQNKEGQDVVITQTGTKLANIGRMTIAKDGAITTELVDTVPAPGPDSGIPDEAWHTDAARGRNVDTATNERILALEAQYGPRRARHGAAAPRSARVLVCGLSRRVGHVPACLRHDVCDRSFHPVERDDPRVRGVHRRHAPLSRQGRQDRRWRPSPHSLSPASADPSSNTDARPIEPMERAFFGF